MNTLLIQIDNALLPENLGNDVQILDCRQISDACSIIGDALVGDLKDNNGQPLYRVLSPIGQILSNFNEYDSGSFHELLNQWFDVFIKVLINGIQDETNIFTIHCPNRFITWLNDSDNLNYNQIGYNLSKTNGNIQIEYEVFSDIVCDLLSKIKHEFDKTGPYDYIVFDDGINVKNASIIKRLKKIVLANMNFRNVSVFFKSHSYDNEKLKDNKNSQFKISQSDKGKDNSDDNRQFRYKNIQLGITSKKSLQLNRQSEYEGCEIRFNNNDILCSICVRNDEDAIDVFLSIIYGTQVITNNMNYEQISSFLIMNKGYYVYKEPEIYVSPDGVVTSFYAELRKETETYICKLEFSSSFNTFYTKRDIEDFVDSQGTLFLICVELK